MLHGIPRFVFIIACLACSPAAFAAIPVRAEEVLQWSALPSIPDQAGFAGSYAGVCGKTLVVAGGASFSGRPPWEREKKTWHKTIFTLEPGAAAWRLAGELPRAAGCGLSLPAGDGFLMIGGGDAQENFTTVWKATRAADGSIKFAALPSLPSPLAMPAGAVAKNIVYVAGGIARPDAATAENVLYKLDLNNINAGWRTLKPCPGGARFLATGGAIGDTFYLFGGARPAPTAQDRAAREWLRDAWSFHPETGWKRLADLPRPVVAPPSSALPAGQTHLLLVGGDDGAQFHAQPADHKGFPRAILGYHTITDTWTQVGGAPFSLVTTALVPWDAGFVVTGGERQPGMRSTAVWMARIVEMRASFGIINYLVLAGYLLGMVVIGWVCSRRNKSTDDYFKAGGRIPWWAAGVSIYGTMLSSVTFMAIPAKAYATDWTYFWVNVPIFLTAPIIIHLYLPFFRRLEVTSVYEYLEKRFNLGLRLYGSAVFIAHQVTKQAIVILLPSLALATVSDMNLTTCVILMSALSILYTLMGGIEAVVWTDVAQVVLLLGSAIVSILIIVCNTPGGAAGFWATAMDCGKFHMFNWTWSPTTASNAFWVIFSGSIFSALVPYTSDQSVVQRYMTTSSEKKARGAIWMNAAMSIPTTFLFFGIGTALFVFYKHNPAQLNPVMEKTDAIFPAFIVQSLPAGVAGLVIAGVFAAAQSTTSGSLNSVVTALMTDYHRRLGGKTRGPAGDLRLARLLTAAFGVLATCAALLLARSGVTSLWDMGFKFLGLIASGLGGLFALGIFVRRAGAASAVIGVAASTALVCCIQIGANLHLLLYTGIGMGGCIVAGWLASLVFPSEKDLSGLTIYTLKK